MTQTHPSHLQSFADTLPLCAAGTYIHPSASLIGDIQLGADSSVWPGAVIRGDVNFIRIGMGTNVQDLSVLHVSHATSENPTGAPLTIGDHVTIGHRVILHGCTIENECLIGMGSIVMDQAVLQKNVLLAAGSLVPEGKVLESGCLYMGSPVKKIRALSPQEMAYFLYSAQHYIRLKNTYLAKPHAP